MITLQKINRPSLVRRAINWHVQSSTNWQPAPDRPTIIIIIIVGIIQNQGVSTGLVFHLFTKVAEL
jgi:hypothetical protein